MRTLYAATLLSILSFVATCDAEIIVSTTSDSGAGSLRHAIGNAPSDELITFSASLSGQTIILTSGQLLIEDSLTIDGSSLKIPLTISGNATSRIFKIESGQSVTLDSLRLQDGNGTPLVGSSPQGGAILNEGTLELTRCTVVNNSASDDLSGGSGGGIFNSGVITLSHSSILYNFADWGAGLSSNGTSFSATHSLFFNNLAYQGGGGLLTAGSGTSSIAHSSFISNLGFNFGGGAVLSTTDLTISHSSFLENDTTANGGGFYVSGGTFSLSHSVIAQNGASLSNNSGRDIFKRSGASVTLSGVNFISELDGSGITDPSDGSILSGDPMLASLGSYGGLTQTRPPLPGSPLINAATGSTTTTDQRDFPINAVPDLGAAESGTFLIVNTVLDENDGIDTGLVSLRDAIAAATDSPAAPGTFITFDKDVFANLFDVIRLTEGQIDIPNANALTLYAGDLSWGVTVDADYQSRIFNIGSEIEPALPTSLTLHTLTLARGRAASGGALLNRSTSLSVLNSAFVDNIADGAGGAISNEGAGGSSTLSIFHSSFFDNGAQSGGAISNDGLNGDALLQVSHASILDNDATGSGGGIVNNASGATALISNSIVAENTATSAPELSNNGGTLTLSNVNFIRDLSGSGLTDPEDGSIINYNLMVAPRAHYGGPTETRPPRADNSYLVNASRGSTATKDQRGFPVFENLTSEYDLEGVNQFGGRSSAPDLGAAQSSDFFFVSTESELRDAIAEADAPGTFISVDRGFAVVEPIDIENPNNLVIFAARRQRGGEDDGIGPNAAVTLEGQPSLFNIVTEATSASPTAVTLHSFSFSNSFSSSTGLRGPSILNQNNRLVISNSTFYTSGNLNSFEILGSAIRNKGVSGDASLHVSRCSFLDRDASSVIHNEGELGKATLSISHCTFFNDVRTGFAEQVLATSSRITNNGSAGEAKVYLSNSALAQNSRYYTPDIINTDGEIILSGRNYISNLSESGLTDPGDGSILTGYLPFASRSQVGSIQRQFTILPLPGSRLIDAAISGAARLDQRGLPMVNAPDIGAVELQADEPSDFYLDPDGDGYSTGLEELVGSDPLVSDPGNPNKLRIVGFNESGQPLVSVGGYSPWSSLFLRSVDLVTFTAVYLSNSSSDDGVFTFYDSNPPEGGKAFYIFEIVEIPVE